MATAIGESAATRVDPITFEVIRHRLLSITEEQAITIKSVSGSPVVTQAADFNTGLFLANGDLITTGKNVLVHAASLGEMVRHTLEDCSEDPGIGEGDMFVINDPYKGAIHQQDFGIFAPLFHEGKLIAWSGAAAHQLDVGGAVFGSWTPKASEIYQEAMLVPPVKLIEGGKRRTDVWNMIMRMSRLPHALGLDFKAMVAANNVAQRQMADLIERYGVDVVTAVMKGSRALTAARLRQRLLELPDGVYGGASHIDHDGFENNLYDMKVRVTKLGDGMTVDFTGTSPQAKGSFNVARGAMVGGVMAAIFPILAYDLPWNSGVLDAVKIVAPDGIICNATWPAPTSAGPLGAMWVVELVVVEALSKMVGCSDTYRREGQGSSFGAGDLMTCAGLNQRGEPFGNTFTEQMGAGAGAYPHRDGINAGGAHTIAAQQLINTEAMELTTPVLYLYRKLITDTAGPGETRGGLSGGAAFTIHDVNFLQTILISHGVEVPNAKGLFGGYPASCNMHHLLRGSDVLEKMAAGQLSDDLGDYTGERVDVGAKPGEMLFVPGDVFEWTWQGGGGYGDPLLRDPAKVAADVADGYVSDRAAGEFYGVILSGTAVDEAATETRRDEIREDRKARAVVEREFTPPEIDGGASRTMPIGPYLGVVTVEDGEYVSCRCGSVLAPWVEDWKSYLGSIPLTDEQVGPRVKLHRELEAKAYLCPSCGMLHSVDFGRPGQLPLHDVSPVGARPDSADSTGIAR